MLGAVGSGARAAATSAALSTGIVVASVVAAWASYSRIELIPELLLDTTSVTVDAREIATILAVYLAWHLPVLTLTFAGLRPAPVLSARATVSGLYGIALASSSASVTLFLLALVSFSPNLFALAAGYSIIGMVGAYALAERARGGRQVWRRLWVELAGALFRPVSVAVYACVLLPPAAAGVYMLDRDVANAINDLRARLSTGSGDTGWLLLDVFPDIRFRQPIDIAAAGPDALYVLERGGRLHRLTWAPRVTSELLLDFSTEVGPAEVENGALGVALHPRFAAESPDALPYAFVYYTHVVDGEQTNRLARFDLGRAGLDERLRSETRLFELARSSRGFHNGGSVAFGPDGFLYVSLGEAGDLLNPQTIHRSFFSGILRLDVDRQGGAISHPPRRQPSEGRSAGYFIPSDNPFVGVEGALEEFWAIGLRNAFRMSFDPATGELWAGDVGGNRFEEINRIERGGNYGWPFREGPEPRPGVDAPEFLVGTLREPFFSYAHTALDRAVIGGVVYRSERYPSLAGRYVFADNYSGRIFAVSIADNPPPEPLMLARTRDLGQYGLTSLVMAPNGELLVTSMGSPERDDGRIWLLRRQGDLDMAWAGGAATGLPAEAESAAEIYTAACARCHGDSGRGDGVGAEEFDGTMPDFSDPGWQASRSDDEISLVIRDGGGAAEMSDVMAPFGDAYSDATIRRLTEHVRQLERVTP